MFRVGQKVVCVNASDGAWEDRFGCASGSLSKGEIYIIISMNADGADVFLRLHGVMGGWLQERFRPLVEKETDISVFTEILKTTKPKINA